MPDSSSEGPPSSYHSPVDATVQYKIAFDNWQFQVDSYWQRNSYFAAFQSVALAGAWKLLGHRSALMASFAGMLLAAIWYLNNLKIHSYVRYWWEMIGAIEKRLIDPESKPLRLVMDYEMNSEIFRVPRYRVFKYSTIINFIPLIFFGAWVWMVVASIQAMETHGQLKTVDLIGFSRFAVPNNFYSPGIVYGVDAEGNSYVLADIATEANLEIRKLEEPLSVAEFSGKIQANEIASFIRENARGDLVSRALDTIQIDGERRGRPIGDIFIQMLDVERKTIQKADALHVLHDTPFWRERRQGLRNLRLFLVVETVGVHRAILTFPSADLEMLHGAFGHLSEMGESIKSLNERSIEVTPRSLMTLAFKATELVEGTSLVLVPTVTPGSVPQLVSYKRGLPPSPIMQANLSAIKDVVVPEATPLVSTHDTSAPKTLLSFGRNATYGELFDQLSSTIRGTKGAGLNGLRIFDSGMGFAAATIFEVTKQDGTPLPGPDRFLWRKCAGKRLRGFYITVAAHPGRNAIVTTKRPEDYFTMRYGLNKLPDDMAQIPIEQGTSVQVYVLEFERSATHAAGRGTNGHGPVTGISGGLRELHPGECGSSAEQHMIQAGILK